MVEQVIDASIAIKWVIQTETFRKKALRLVTYARRHSIKLIGPPLLEYEVESNLQRRLFLGRASVASVDAAIQGFYTVGVHIVDLPDALPVARRIARRARQEKVYDATYAALAELRGYDFWTADRAFYDAVRDELDFVYYLPDYPG